MRSLVQPLPSMHCELCGGELLLKRIEPDDPAFEIDVQIYLCAKCSHEQARRVIHDRYTAHVSRGVSAHR
jgi:DNA-directed RNA polymerase subunit RPC12/RpoP